MIQTVAELISYRRRVLRLTLLALFLFSSTPFQPETQAEELFKEMFKEENWRGCITESSRALIENPQHEQAKLLKAISELRINRNSSVSLAELCESTTTSLATKLTASYELGRLNINRGNTTKAFNRLKYTFENSQDKQLFQLSGCSLYFLFEENPKLLKENLTVSSQLKTLSEVWSRSIWDTCKINPKKKRPALTGKPGEFIIWFYRSQISPALGRRCSLTPSCSEYGRLALRKHGALGIALIGDRSIREPEVVHLKKHIVKKGEHYLCSDNIEEHDWWMKK